jgi:hypothetical protein
VEPFLDVLDGLPGLSTRRVREYIGTIRHTLGVERLQSRQHSRVQGDRMWSAALRARNPNDAVQKVYEVPVPTEKSNENTALISKAATPHGSPRRRCSRDRRHPREFSATQMR